MSGCTVLVCGSRTWAESTSPTRPLERQIVFDRLDEMLVRYRGDLIVIHGGANGADSEAGQWLHHRRRDVDGMREVWRAEWDRLGPSAGPLRNQQMLASLVEHRNAGRTVLGLAFRSAGRSVGTDDMVRRLRCARIEGRIIKAPIQEEM